MPFKISTEQAAFALAVSLNRGLPIASVERVGAGLWVKCCPLCGCLELLKHTPGLLEQATYGPDCSLKVTHPTLYVKWQTAHGVTGQTAVVLQLKQTQVIPLGDAPSEVREAA